MIVMILLIILRISGDAIAMRDNEVNRVHFRENEKVPAMEPEASSRI